MIKRWIRPVVWVAAMAALMAPSGVLEAQQGGQRRMNPRQGQERADLERRVRMRFGEMMRERLGLSEEQGEQLSAVMERFREDRMQFVRSEQALRQRVDAAFLEGTVSDDEANALLARMIELREQELALFRSEQEALREVLAPPQLLQFHAMREQLNQRVRELGQQPGMRRRGGGPGADVEGDFDAGGRPSLGHLEGLGQGFAPVPPWVDAGRVGGVIR
jgi:hypothetical protein